MKESHSIKEEHKYEHGVVELPRPTGDEGNG